jgi:hypothetical protein
VTTLKLVVFPEKIETDPGCVVIDGATGSALVDTVVDEVPADEFT